MNYLQEPPSLSQWQEFLTGNPPKSASPPLNRWRQHLANKRDSKSHNSSSFIWTSSWSSRCVKQLQGWYLPWHKDKQIRHCFCFHLKVHWSHLRICTQQGLNITSVVILELSVHWDDKYLKKTRNQSKILGRVEIYHIWWLQKM